MHQVLDKCICHCYLNPHPHTLHATLDDSLDKVEWKSLFKGSMLLQNHNNQTR